MKKALKNLAVWRRLQDKKHPEGCTISSLPKNLFEKILFKLNEEGTTEFAYADDGRYGKSSLCILYVESFSSILTARICG